MKLPVKPPPIDELFFEALSQPDEAQIRDVSAWARLGPAPGGKYRHWDTFRQAPPLAGTSPELQWAMVKIARRALYRPLPLRDATGRAFQYAIPNVALEMLHQIDRRGGGSIQGNEQITNNATRDTYLFKSIVEEAITSSQLEGASTTRKVAKAMIQEGRAPRNTGERMMLNNYDGMLYVRRFVQEALTPAIVMELQRTLTEGTLDEPDAAGRFRREDEYIVIEDPETGDRLHTPPPASELEARMEAMCDFANGKGTTEFMPPAVRAILLHFWLAYDHPFVDGNGRTARALFYWSMAREGYWLCEYLSISRILKKARGQYARAYLYSETDENDVTYFLLYQMRVLLRAIDDLHTYLARKSREQHEAEALLRQSPKAWDLNPRQLALMTHAIKTPTARYTVESHRISHGVTMQTARTDLISLVEKGLLDQGKAGRAFTFTPSRALRDQLHSPGRESRPRP